MGIETRLASRQPHPRRTSPPVPCVQAQREAASPGTLANGVCTPGTTDITASVKDAAGQDITQGQWVWQLRIPR